MRRILSLGFLGIPAVLVFVGDFIGHIPIRCRLMLGQQISQSPNSI